MNPHGKRLADKVTSLIRNIGFWKCHKCGKVLKKPVEAHSCRKKRK